MCLDLLFFLTCFPFTSGMHVAQVAHTLASVLHDFLQQEFSSYIASVGDKKTQRLRGADKV